MTRSRPPGGPGRLGLARLALFDVRLRPGDHLVDHVVPKSACGQKCVDLALPFGRLEQLPPPELARDRSSRALGFAFDGHLSERGVDRLASDALARELADEGAVALRTKA